MMNIILYILVILLFACCRTAKLRIYTTNDSNVVRIDSISTTVKGDSTHRDSVVYARHHVSYLNHPKTLRPVVPALILITIVVTLLLILKSR